MLDVGSSGMLSWLLFSHSMIKYDLGLKLFLYVNILVITVPR